MIPYALWFYWVAARGYRLRPWRSPYLRWRLETYSGIPAEEITRKVFWRFLWEQRQALGSFLRWGAEMKRLERQGRRGAQPQYS